jgi:hypothetical protein
MAFQLDGQHSVTIGIGKVAQARLDRRTRGLLEPPLKHVQGVDGDVVVGATDLLESHLRAGGCGQFTRRPIGVDGDLGGDLAVAARAVGVGQCHRQVAAGIHRFELLERPL